MNCKEKILSNDYYDVITDFPLTLSERISYDLCYVNIDNVYNLVYINRAGIPNPLENLYDYQNLPNLYGLMQDSWTAPGFNPNNLIASGIIQVQREPLSLTGKGVVMCFIDTGERVILLSG